MLKYRYLFDVSGVCSMLCSIARSVCLVVARDRRHTTVKSLLRRGASRTLSVYLMYQGVAEAVGRLLRGHGTKWSTGSCDVVFSDVFT